MRRLTITGVVLVVAAAVALIVGTVAQGSDTYKFDVIFDDARGLVSGQQVKIAGAEAGQITNVVVTPDDKARVEASISGPFQMHTNASCIIRPDGLIAENYLDCDPGSQSKPLLKASGAYPPTVPVSQTSEPVELLDLFNIFNLPTRERFQALIDELGITTAGNGDQINAILQRVNPTLQSAQRVISILDRQDTEIADEITNTNTLAAAGASHITDTQSFIKQAAGLTARTSDHSSAVEQAIHRLPGLLSAATPAMTELNAVATNGTPLLENIRAAVPSLNHLDNDIGPFTSVAKPALTSLNQAITIAIPDLRRLTPVTETIGSYLRTSAPTTKQFSNLVVNLIQHGFSENFLSVLYYVSTALSRYDSNSHLLSTFLINPNDGACSMFATTPVSGCSAHYGSDSGDTAARTPARAGRHSTTAGHSARPSTSSPTPSTSSPTSSSGSNTSASSSSNLSGTLANLGSSVSSGVSTVAGAAAGTVGQVTSGLTGSTATSDSSNSTSSSSLNGLLGYLLK